MSKSIRVPDPVYEKLTRVADRQDVSNGIVVKEWMEKAQKFEEMEVRR